MDFDDDSAEAADDPERQAEILRRIEEIKERLMKLSDGQAIIGEAEGMPPELELQFLEHVLAVEEEPTTTCAKLLIEAGIELPPPDDLNEEELHGKLWEVIRGLAEMNTYLEFSDHLSDRDLYTRLWTETLSEPTWDMRGTGNAACHIQMTLGESGEKADDWLVYYADEEDRRRIREEFPDEPLPPRKQRLYDRDRLLPRPEFPPSDEEEEDEDAL
jgi:hypothetical protein